MKKSTLNLGNRTVKKAQTIDTTHDIEVEKKPTPTVKKKEPTKKGFRKTSEKRDNVKTARFNDEEFEKLDSYMAEHNMSFAELVRYVFNEKGII